MDTDWKKNWKIRCRVWNSGSRESVEPIQSTEKQSTLEMMNLTEKLSRLVLIVRLASKQKDMNVKTPPKPSTPRPCQPKTFKSFVLRRHNDHPKLKKSPATGGLRGRISEIRRNKLGEKKLFFIMGWYHNMSGRRHYLHF